MKHLRVSLCGILSIGAWMMSPLMAFAEPVVSEDTAQASKGGLYGNIRYRNEYVEEDKFAKDAYANTLQLRAGYRHALDQKLTGTVEALGLLPIGTATYNNTINDVTDRPGIFDPPTLRLNQANLAYQPNEQFKVTAGRQFIRLFNQRFVGSKSGRQVDQVFDAVASELKFDNVSLNYAFAFGVERSVGNFSSDGRWSMLTHIASASYAPIPQFSFEPYLLDFNPDRHGDLASTTMGARVNLKKIAMEPFAFSWIGDVARQQPYASNRQAQGYFLNEGVVTYDKLDLKLGYEFLGGDGVSAMQTPLATINIFNGWVTKFATIPVNGLTDTYIGLIYRAKPLFPDVPEGKFQLVWHDFNSVHASQAYGHEWDASWTQKFSDAWSSTFRYCNYVAQDFSSDTKKISLVVQYDF